MLRHYEEQTDEAASGEDEAPHASGDVMMPIPSELVSVVRDLIEQHHRKGHSESPPRAKHQGR